MIFFFNDTSTTEIYTLSLHDALPISGGRRDRPVGAEIRPDQPGRRVPGQAPRRLARGPADLRHPDKAGLRPLRRSEEHTSELQSRQYLVCRLLLAKKKTHAMISSSPS